MRQVRETTQVEEELKKGKDNCERRQGMGINPTRIKEN